MVKVLRELAGCTEGSDCPLPADNQQSWQARVTAELRARGLCAGQHQEGVSDQITVVPPDGTPGLRWESYYVFACTVAKLGDPPDIDTCPIKGRGKVRWAIPADSWVPVAPAPPPVPPDPTTTPTPAPGACAVTPGMLDPSQPFRADVKPHPPAQTLDLTLLGCGSDVVAALDPQHVHAHACLNFCCPFEEDKGTGPCAEKLWGKAVWSAITGDVRLVATANTNTVKVAEGKGTVKLCGSDHPGDAAACWLIDVDLGRIAQGLPLCFPDAANANLCQKDKR